MFDVTETLAYLRENEKFFSVNQDLFNIYNKKITPYIEKRLDKDIKGDGTRNEAKGRISAINILPQIVAKKSNVYRTNCIRTMVSGGSQKELDNLINTSNYKSSLELANKMLNIHNCVAIEPIVDKNYFRVVPANKFIVKGDNSIDNVMTEYIKIIKTKKESSSYTNEMMSYTMEEFVTFNSKGEVIETIPNELGFIPVVYATRDCVTLVPEEDQDTLNMVTLLPLMLTDMNFAIKYQCFSIFYTVNCKAKNMTISPNAVWNFESTGQDGDKPELGLLTPTAKVDDILLAISKQYNMWLEEKGLKFDAFDSSSFQNISGIAKAIDKADATNDINYQRTIFQNMEKELLRQYGLMQYGREWIVDVSFEVQSIVEETPTEKVDRIIKKLDKNLISTRRAILEANAHMSEQSIADMMIEIEQERKQKELEEMSDGQVRSGDDTSGDAESSAI